MITILGRRIEPTRFPDGTSQVWKLPDEVLNADRISVDWRFEREDELFSIAQLASLLGDRPIRLHVPYLPFARQDKPVSNGQTFALHPFAGLLNALRLEQVAAVDAHNPRATADLIHGFVNVGVSGIHDELMKKVRPDLVVFPDRGAKERYAHLRGSKHVVFEKERNQATGEILGHALVRTEGSPELLADGKRLFIIDDICDGGATFLSIAKAVNAMRKDVRIDLFVTHGIFSKGRELLEKAGIALHTTNSLPRNADGIPV